MTVTFRDLGGGPVAGDLATLHVTGSAVVTAVSSITNAHGEATFHVGDATSETVTVSASVGIAGAPFGLTTIDFDAHAPSATKSTLVADLATVAAGSGGSATLTLTLRDSSGTPLALQDVSIGAGAGSSHFIGSASGSTSIHGTFSVRVKDTQPETITYTAGATRDNVKIAQTATVTFAPAVSAAKSSISASPASVPADNSSSATVTVTLADGTGHPAAGRSVKLELHAIGKSTMHAHVHGTNPVTTDANGVATFAVRDGSGESVSVTALDVDQNLTISAPPGPRARIQRAHGRCGERDEVDGVGIARRRPRRREALLDGHRPAAQRRGWRGAGQERHARRCGRRLGDQPGERDD